MLKDVDLSLKHILGFDYNGWKWYQTEGRIARVKDRIKHSQ